MVSSSKRRWIWVAWLIIWPASLYMICQHTNFQEIKWLDLSAFTALAVVVALFPIMVNQIPVFFLNGITLVIYLNFGLFIELIITTLSITIVLLQVRMTRKDIFRIPLNYLMFLVMSVSVAGVYHLFELPGSEEKTLETPLHIIAILAYSLTLFLLNHVLITLTRRLIYGKRDKIFERSFFWEFMTTFYILPAALLLHLLYHEIGAIAVVFIGFSIVSTSYILRLYYGSRSMNERLRMVSEIGHELTAQLNVKETLDLFMERIVELVPVDQALLFDVREEGELNLIRLYDPKNHSPYKQGIRINKGEGIGSTFCANGAGIRYGKRQQWLHNWKGTAPVHSESLMCVPIQRESQMIGMLVLLSDQRNVYEKYQYTLVHLLADFMAVSLLNAVNYEQTKKISERCALTGLYNYRYFEKEMQKQFEYRDKSEPVSLIMLDLDYFKQVNDMYGHEAGNDVLRQVADRLRLAVAEEGVLTRYGGEEFAIILPGYSSDKAAAIASKVQQRITERIFITQHFLEDQSLVTLAVTASIGVASYPENSEDHLELVRHADRAMYVGAKQRGRNRVAIYDQIEQPENIPS
ncbi:sensor domain-containing diguanylate cyclase [Terribacillus sp. DMT04]|uniref:sensor domain-containing diguanylate cyclase n=1 Tax=Terribacillus sp. DMT04 TaxID=2850441 RepID=UPI001C2C3E6A|nr:sensor domain-containing diguanylate cyclase [Terribacillus sp. DMT04]QXE00571.1 sensor domain-containing diguanylate cyclase [Terribacillus sp. DMT04]